MNDPESPTPDHSELAELKQQYAALSRQTSYLFIGLVVLSLTLTAFVGLQARRAGKDLDVVRPQAAQWLETNKKERPVINGFVEKLVAYGRTHPDYLQILAKYGIKPTTNAGPALAVPGK